MFVLWCEDFVSAYRVSYACAKKWINSLRLDKSSEMKPARSAIRRSNRKKEKVSPIYHFSPKLAAKQEKQVQLVNRLGIPEPSSWIASALLNQATTVDHLLRNFDKQSLFMIDNELARHLKYLSCPHNWPEVGTVCLCYLRKRQLCLETQQLNSWKKK